MAIFAICRGTKTFGTQLAECLARGLEYPIVGEEVLRDAAGRMGVSKERLEERLTGRPTLWEPFSTMRRVYVLALQAALAERVVDGNLVYHGLTGGLLLHGLPATLTLRCIAPMEMRVRAIMGESEMDADTAASYIRDLDEARSRWVRALHDSDVGDPALYDVMVNLAHIDVDGACGMVARMIRQPEFEITADVRRRLEDFRTACRVKVALVEDEELAGLELDATARDGRVDITGRAPLRSSGKMGDRLARCARGVPGVDEVHLKIDWFDPYP